MVTFVEKFCGALLGTHTGDALGMPLEGASPGSIKKNYGQVREMLDARLGRGTYTDDTEMMIALAESLVRCRGVNGADLAQAYLENFNPLRGYGAGTRKALELLRSGISWEEAGKRVFEQGSYGNGASMRIAPVGCLYSRDLEKLKEAVHLSSLITHAHPWGEEGALLQAYAVALAVQADPRQGIAVDHFLASLESVLDEGSPFREKLQAMQRLLPGEPGIEEVVLELGNDSRTVTSVPAAIFSFLKNAADFEETVVYAVGLGGDTDTIAAMAGAIAGGYHGKPAIPERWLSQLEKGAKGADYIEQLARDLYDLHTDFYPHA